tara:strand:+ start:342 stop:539 length:198 start_codon:yes stop_codon:yes gene_type:complete
LKDASTHHIVDGLVLSLLDVVEASFATLLLELLELGRRRLSLGSLGGSSAARAIHGGVRRFPSDR